MNHHVNGMSLHSATWRKSSHSNPSGNCVEAADLPGGVAVRDSRSPDGPALAFAGATWHAFLAAVKRGGDFG